MLWTPDASLLHDPFCLQDIHASLQALVEGQDAALLLNRDGTNQNIG